MRKAKETAREETERAEESATNAVEGLRSCQVVILEATQANATAMFEYMQEASAPNPSPN
jgi:hypothetical protein